MAQTLDYNKSVTNVYPVVPTLDEDMFIISKLDDEPNDVGGLSADQLKAEFDKAGRIISDYINTGLIPAVLASDLTEQTRAAAEAERVTNEQERVSNENKRIADETARKSAEDLRVTHENERVAAEEIRNENENLRVSNEQQRIINETERQDLERGYVAQSKNNADAAIAAKNAAEKARDEAKEIVDGDFILASEKGTAGGVAELDNTGKVPTGQLPTAFPASDVYDWAKQPQKPTYTANEVGAAPAGYGYGEQITDYAASTEEEMEDSLLDIIGAMPNYTTKQVKGILTFLGVNTYYLTTIYKHTSVYAMVTLQTVRFGGASLQKVYAGSAWYPIEWVNPSMTLGVEYRTTERYNGEAVYVKAVDCGALPNATVKNIQTGITGTIFYVSVCISQGNIRAFLPLMGDASTRARFNTSGGSIQITTTEDCSVWAGIATVKYTKT